VASVGTGNVAQLKTLIPQFVRCIIIKCDGFQLHLFAVSEQTARQPKNYVSRHYTCPRNRTWIKDWQNEN